VKKTNKEGTMEDDNPVVHFTFNGERWKCDIWTDKFRLKSAGSNAYPGNFEFFREKLQWMTDGKMF
jgi:hypothetical protein